MAIQESLAQANEPASPAAAATASTSTSTAASTTASTTVTAWPNPATPDLLGPVVLPRSTVLDYPRGVIADPYPTLESPERFRSWFNEEGCIVLRGALPPRLCQAGIDAFRREVLPDHLAFFERHASGKFERHVYTPAGFMKYPIMNLQDLPERRYAAFRRAGLNVITHPAIQRAMRVLCNEPARIVHTMYFDGNQTTWAHRDGHYIDSGHAGSMIGVWVAAEDIDPQAGRFFVLPRSHRMRVPGEEGDPNSPEYKQRMADFVRNGPLDCLAPVLRQGDVLLWSSLTIHGSLPTADPRCSRRSFTAHYVPDSHPYQWNVRPQASRRRMRFNKVEVILHRDDSSWLRRLRNAVREDWPRAYGVLQSVRKKMEG
jgi:phytanoyl-CoA hydroxylase